MLAEKTVLHEPADQVSAIEEISKIAGRITALLVREGFLTPKQVQYGARIRSRLESPRPFLEVLRELKYVTDEQITQVIRTNYEIISLENLLLELGLFSEENLKIDLKIQAEEKPPRPLIAASIISRRHTPASSLRKTR